MDKQKILITGGLGFIFSHVTEYYVKKGWDVVVIDNESEGSHPEIVDGSFTYYKKNVCDLDVIDLIHKEAPDYVIHAAAISDVDYSIKEPYKVLSENMRGNLNMFEACRELKTLKHFLYISTDEVYGECEHKKKEDEILFPKNPYSCSKAIGSLMRMTYDSTYPELKDKTSETRFCNVFGPRQDTRKIMPLLKHALHTGEAVPLHNEGQGYREYIYVKNIPPAIELILDKEASRTFNITTNNGLTVHELVEAAEKVTGKKINTYPTNRPGMDMKYQMDATRIVELGWKPPYSFDEGLKEYLLEK